MFGKLPKGSVGVHLISDTLENSRDLHWFIQRYPMESKDMDRLEARAAQHVESISLVDQILSGNYTAPEFKLAIPPREYQKIAAAMLIARGGLLLADDVGLGKAQPVDALVMTPTGWRQIGTLRVGEEVSDPDGGIGLVTGVYPKGSRQVFAVTSMDGASAECCDDHLWHVYTSNDRCRDGIGRVLPLKSFRGSLFDIRGNGNKCSRYFLPVPVPVQFRLQPTELPIHPYLMGVILGDGGLSSGSVNVTKSDAQVIDRARHVVPDGVEFKQECQGGITWRITKTGSSRKNPLITILRDLGLYGKLTHEKWVPIQYLFASVEDRIELLHGLMDTDGDANESAHIFNTSAPRLRDDVVELVRSLGGIASVTTVELPQYTYKGEKKTGRESYRVNVRLPFNPFLLERKAERWSAPNMARAITSVDHIGQKETVCIGVSTKRNLYITNGHLVTHNTASFITALCDRRLLPAVVVTLTHLPRQWKAEIERFAPGLNVHIVKQGKPYDMTARRGSDRQPSLISALPDVVLINYHKLAQWAETLGAVAKSVCFDEIQELRKDDSGKYRAAAHLVSRVPFKCGLSATPIYNMGGEIYSVLNCLFPGQLGTRDEFGTEWCGYGSVNDKSKIKNAKAFSAYARESGMMLRRTRAEVGRELPEAQIVPQYIDADSAALDKVGASCAELARLILAGGPEGARGEKMRASEELSNMLRQATGIAKAPYVAEFVRLLLESGEKVVLYGWHRSVYDIWLDRLKDFKPALYTGSESIPQKEESKRRFIAGDTDLIIISLRSGAGLDGLQKVCRIVVFGELDWSPGVHEQNIGRVLRDGQPESVTAYYLLSDEGSDPTVSQVLGVKRQQVEGIRRNPGEEELVEKLQTDGAHIRKLAEQYLQKQKTERAA